MNPKLNDIFDNPSVMLRDLSFARFFDSATVCAASPLQQWLRGSMLRRLERIVDEPGQNNTLSRKLIKLCRNDPDENEQQAAYLYLLLVEPLARCADRLES